jgi:SpoVK/Ycf46/Vps4 family AAA+-type ATPase
LSVHEAGPIKSDFSMQGGTRPQLAEDITLEMIGHDPRLEGYTGADLRGLIEGSAVQVLQESFDADSKTFKQPIDKRLHLRHLHEIIEKKRLSVSGKVNAMIHFIVACSNSASSPSFAYTGTSTLHVNEDSGRGPSAH